MRTSAIKKNHKVYIFKHQQTSSGGGGGGADLENNKTATIDVSTYTEPVEITPTAGKDGMKKATVTLDNIPSGGDVESNKAVTIDVSSYTAPVEVTPTAGKDSMAKATVTLSNIPSPSGGVTAYAFYCEVTNTTLFINSDVSPTDLSNCKFCFSSDIAENAFTIVESSYMSENSPYLDFSTYEKLSNTSFSIEDDGHNNTYVRDATKDFSIEW